MRNMQIKQVDQSLLTKACQAGTEVQTCLPASEPLYSQGIPGLLYRSHTKNVHEGNSTCSRKASVLFPFTIKCLDQLSRQVFLIFNILLRKWLFSNCITNWTQTQNFIRIEEGEKTGIILLHRYFLRNLFFFLLLPR